MKEDTNQQLKINTCPHCNGMLHIVKKQCQGCGLILEAKFEENPLVYLSRKEQDFLLQFILTGGNFKALGEKLGLTYPTLRAHLDRIISRLTELDKTASAEAILEAIDKGEISPEEGIKQLKGIKEGSNHDKAR